MKQAILSIIIVFATGTCFAQSDVKAVFGTLPRDEKNTHSGTLEQVLSNPRIVLDNEAYHVDSFYASILPAQPADLIGPFTIAGGKLDARTLNSLRDMGGKSGRLFIDNIKVSTPGGKSRVVNSIVIKYKR
jgi:hypothetical protein